MDINDVIFNTDDILSLLFQLLDSPEELVVCERVCKRWKRVSSQCILWKQSLTSQWDHWNRGIHVLSSETYRDNYRKRANTSYFVGKSRKKRYVVSETRLQDTRFSSRPSWNMQFFCLGNRLIHIEFFDPGTVSFYDKTTLEPLFSRVFPKESHFHLAQDYSCFAYADESNLCILDTNTLEIIECIDLAEFEFLREQTYFTDIKLANRRIAMFQTYDAQFHSDNVLWVDLATKKVISERPLIDATDLTQSYSVEQDYNLIRIVSRLDGAEREFERMFDHRESDLFPVVHALSATEFAAIDGKLVFFYDADNDIYCSCTAPRPSLPTNVLRYGSLLLICSPRSIIYLRLIEKRLEIYAEWMLPAEIQQARWFEVRFTLDEEGNIYVLLQRSQKKIFKLSIPKRAL